MQPFTVTVRTSDRTFAYTAISESSIAAYFDAAEAQGDAPCAITVTPYKALA